MKHILSAFRLFSPIRNGISANIFAQVVSLLIQIGTVPILLHYWSLEKYGLWLVLCSAQALLGLIDFGFLASVMNRVSLVKGAGLSKQEVSLNFGQGVTIAVLSGILGVTLGLLVITLKLQSTLDGELTTAIFFSLLSFQLMVFNPLVDAAFRVESHYALGSFLLDASRLVEWLFGVLFLFLAPSMSSFALGLFVGRFFSLSFILYYVEKNSFVCRFRLHRIELSRIRILAPGAMAWMSTKISDVLTIQGSTIALAKLLSPADAAVFNSYRTISRTLMQAAGVFSNSSWPRITSYFASGQLQDAKRYVWLTIRRVMTTAALGAAVLALSAPLIFQHWAKGKIPYLGWEFSIFLISAIFSSLAYSARIALVALAKLEAWAKYNLVISALAILSFGILTYWFDYQGALIALAGSELTVATVAICFLVREMRRLSAFSL